MGDIDSTRRLRTLADLAARTLAELDAREATLSAALEAPRPPAADGAGHGAHLADWHAAATAWADGVQQRLEGLTRAG